ncbi:hypothetical protein [Angustibacter aerolatus]
MLPLSRTHPRHATPPQLATLWAAADLVLVDDADDTTTACMTLPPREAVILIADCDCDLLAAAHHAFALDAERLAVMPGAFNWLVYRIA